MTNARRCDLFDERRKPTNVHGTVDLIGQIYIICYSKKIERGQIQFYPSRHWDWGKNGIEQNINTHFFPITTTSSSINILYTYISIYLYLSDYMEIQDSTVN